MKFKMLLKLFCIECLITIIYAQTKPHIIVIVADDIGFNDVPWHNKEVIAPNMQRLAENGLILENSYVQPLCSPSRSALMTGMYPFKLGRQEEVIWPLTPTGLTLDHKIMPQFLKNLGYETHAIGKWHLGFCDWKYTPTERGFDSYRGSYLGGGHYFTHERQYEAVPDSTSGYDYRNNKEVYYNASSIYSTKLCSKWISSNKMQTSYVAILRALKVDGHDDNGVKCGFRPYLSQLSYDVLYDYVSRFDELMLNSDPTQPKFFYIPFQSVHSPLEVPENYTIPYSHIKNEDRRTYLGMVTALDEAIGKMEATLKASGHYDNSVIIFTTDNGGNPLEGGNNWPLRGTKVTLWEGGTRGAAFVHSPLLKNPGRTSDKLVHIVDWFSTVIHLAGGTVSENIDGYNQWEALNEDIPSPRKQIIYNLIKGQKNITGAIRIGDYKLLIGEPGPGYWVPSPEDIEAGGQDFLEKNQILLSKLEKEGAEFYPAFRSDRDSTAGFDREIDIKQYLQNNNAQLYNIKIDPEERNDLSADNPKLVEELFKELIRNLQFYVPSEVPEITLAGDPINFNGTWSPGWCTA